MRNLPSRRGAALPDRLHATYGAPDRHSGGHTYGGYSATIVADEHFVLRIPKELPLAGTAPLLCAGITVYSPLKRWSAGPGKHVGIVGLGGLGHVGVKIARAMGARVTVITTSPAKSADARALGADAVLVSTRQAEMDAAGKSFDLLIDTIANRHDFNPYLRLLKTGGVLAMLGGLPPFSELDLTWLNFNRLVIAGSLVGGLAETQEMLDFCAQHGIVSDIEMIRMDGIEDALDRMDRGDVRYRFVIDMATLAA